MFIFHVKQLLTVASGILTMHMDESTFERSGLSDSIGLVKGQRMRSTWKLCCHHLKKCVADYNVVVTLDLNSARRYCNGETHKHLEQYTCACKSITKKQLSWLLCDETGSSEPQPPSPSVAHFDLFIIEIQRSCAVGTNGTF